MLKKLFRKRHRPNFNRPWGPKYMLFNRRVIIKVEYHKDGTREFYRRNFDNHTWEIDWPLYADYSFGHFDGIEEIIDFDEECDKITALRRMPGCWFGRERIEKGFNPSEPVKEFLKRTGLKYEDVYRPPEQRDNEKYDLLDAFKDFDDLLNFMKK